LAAYESALRESGFEVISVQSPLEARFEIEMGRCGILLTNYITPFSIYQNLADLFRRYCRDGIIAYLNRDSGEDVLDTEIVLTEQDQPDSLVEKLQAIAGRTV
jgi:hypothetical protein